MNTGSKSFTRLLATTFFCLGFMCVQGQTVVDKITSNNQISDFAVAIKKSNLQERLQKSGPFTLFVPTNKAFRQLSDNQKYDSDLLLNHIFMGMATERSLKVMSEVTCLSGQTLSLSSSDNQSISVNSFRIIRTNIKAENGVIHIIDGVIE